MRYGSAPAPCAAMSFRFGKRFEEAVEDAPGPRTLRCEENVVDETYSALRARSNQLAIPLTKKKLCHAARFLH